MNIGPYSLLCGGKRVIWFILYRYLYYLSLLENLKSLFRFVRQKNDIFRQDYYPKIQLYVLGMIRKIHHMKCKVYVVKL